MDQETGRGLADEKILEITTRNWKTSHNLCEPRKKPGFKGHQLEWCESCCTVMSSVPTLGLFCKTNRLIVSNRRQKSNESEAGQQEITGRQQDERLQRLVLPRQEISVQTLLLCGPTKEKTLNFTLVKNEFLPLLGCVVLTMKTSGETKAKPLNLSFLALFHCA